MASDGHGMKFVGPYSSSGCLFIIMYCSRIALSNRESPTLDEAM